MRMELLYVFAKYYQQRRHFPLLIPTDSTSLPVCESRAPKPLSVYSILSTILPKPFNVS